MNIDAKTIAAGGLAAGLLLGAWGLIATDDGPRPTSELGALTEEVAADAGMVPTADAVSFWQRRVDARPDGFLDRTQLGAALIRLGREDAVLDHYAAAETELREAVTANPSYLPAKLALGQALHAQHEFAEARQIAYDVWLQESTSAQALALLGDANFELGDYTAATDYYDRLVGLDRSGPVVSRLSRLAYQTGRPADALALAEEALASSDDLALDSADRAFYWFQLGHVQFDLGAVDDAIASLERAVAISPGHPGATEKLAGVYAAVGRTADAERLYVELLERGAAADLHGVYADLLRARGADAEADEQERLGLALAIETVDRYPAERRHLVGFFLTRDPGRAADLALADLAERQDVGAYDTAAWALYHDGRAAEAWPLAEAAVASGIRDAAVFAHAGLIAAELGDEAAARDLLSTALEINDRFDATTAPLARQVLNGLA